MYLNKVFVYGNLTRDPELRSLPSGVSVASFGIATNRVWTNLDVKLEESAEFHNIVVFGRQADTIAQYLKKGSPALVEGRLQTRSWDAQDGTKRSRTEIVADRVQFGPKSGSGAGGGSKNTETSKKEEITSIEYPSDDINPDEIPF